MAGSQETAATPTRASDLLALAQATLDIGRLGAAREQFFGAAQAAEEEGLTVVRAESAIGAGGLWLHELRVTDERAKFLALVRDALAGLGHERPDLQRRLRARLAAEAAYDGTGKLAELQTIVDDARAAGDAIALAEGLSLLHHAMLTPQYAYDRLEVADEMLMVASAIDARTLVLMAMCWRTVDLVLLGRVEAERALAELRVRAQQYQVLAVQYIVAAIETMLSLRAGRFAEAEALSLASHGLGVETGDADSDACYLVQLLAIRWMQGSASELLGDVEEIERATTIVHAYADYVWTIVAVLAVEADRPDRARAALDRVLASGLRTLPESSAWLPALFCVAEAAAYLDDREAAREVVDLLEPYASLPIIASLGVVCFGSAARSLGFARRTLGDLDGAVIALDEAIRQNRRLGHVPMVAITRADLAQTLLLRDHPGDRARALTLYEAAIPAARSMGMDARAARWRADAESLADAPAPAASFVRKTAHWEVTDGDEVAVVAHSVGMGYLATLLRHPHEEVRATLLTGAVEEQGAQPVLDARAREEYRRQVAELRREIDEADAYADIERAAARRAEFDALLEELTRVVRPGGRSRAFTGGDERARTSVQKALRRAIAAIAASAPKLADALSRSIQTGSVCRFVPVDVPECWHVRVEADPSAAQ
jgi:uncharacterized protein YfcZ (UPF0381/DUF406 family)